MKPKSRQDSRVSTVFRYRLLRLRGQILGWGISLALLGVVMVQFYGTIVAQQAQFDQLLEAYPKEFMAFFGDIDTYVTPSGYLGVEFFSYMPLIVGIFAVLVGSGLFVADEESGRLDLILAHPVSRTSFYWGRVLAFVTATIGILIIAWLGLAVPAHWTDLSEVSAIAMAQPFLSLFAELMLFGMLALLLSLLLPSRRASAMVAGLLLVGDFFVIGLAKINTDLEPIAKLTPLYYYQGGDGLDNFNVVWFVGLVAVALLFALLAWWRFERRDIRVGGEGAWQRPARRSLSRLFPHRPSKQPEVPVPEAAAAQR
jgi:ABC-2 type transport system permease protein